MHLVEGGLLSQQDGPRATQYEPVLCSGWLAQICQDQNRSDVSLAQKGCAINMDEKDKKVGEGGGEGAILSLKDRAEQYHKKREHVTPLNVLRRYWGISALNMLSVSGLAMWEHCLSGIEC